MSNLFRQFIAEIIRDLLEELDRPHPSFKYNSLIRQWHPSLDLMDAEAGDSLTLFPESDWPFLADWCIFSCERVGGTREIDTYQLTSRLPGSETNNEFVAAAHSALLIRPVATDDKAIFARLLDSGQMARRDLLRTLACSSEAQALGRRVLIVPSPSSWLPKIAGASQGETIVSVRVAR